MTLYDLAQRIVDAAIDQLQKENIPPDVLAQIEQRLNDYLRGIKDGQRSKSQH